MDLRIVMLGGPGAGKGTQAKRMAAAWSLPHISTGDIFRRHLRDGTELGKEVQEYLDSGRLVPDDLTCAIVADRLKEPDCAHGFILDGFPRSLPQAEKLDKVLGEMGTSIDVAINVDVPDEEIVERLSARRTCAKCGAIYNLKFDPPPDAETCAREDCDGKLIQREDDQEATIRKRLDVYHETTEPIIEYYDEKGLLKTVSGSGTTDAVFAEIEKVVRATEAG